jgi:hypothetical protein
MPLAGKVALALGVAGALALGAAYGLRGHEPAPRAAATVTAPTTARPSETVAVAPPAETAAPSGDEAAISVEDLPRAPSRLAHTGGAAAPAGPPPTADSSNAAVSLAPELDALQTVRSLLRAGDTAGALNELARYDARFPHGKLRAEALELGVEAETMAGRPAAARARADAFLAEYGDSPLAPRVRTLRDGLGAR